MHEVYVFITKVRDTYIPIAATDDKQTCENYKLTRDLKDCVEMVINVDHKDCPENLLSIINESPYILNELIIDSKNNMYPVTDQEYSYIQEVSGTFISSMYDTLDTLQEILNGKYFKFTKKEKFILDCMLKALYGALESGEYVVYDFQMAKNCDLDAPIREVDEIETK